MRTSSTCQAPLGCHCTGCATFNDLISACDLELSSPLTHVCHRITVTGSVTPSSLIPLVLVLPVTQQERFIRTSSRGVTNMLAAALSETMALSPPSLIASYFQYHNSNAHTHSHSKYPPVTA